MDNDKKVKDRSFTVRIMNALAKQYTVYLSPLNTDIWGKYDYGKPLPLHEVKKYDWSLEKPTIKVPKTVEVFINGMALYNILNEKVSTIMVHGSTNTTKVDLIPIKITYDTFVDADIQTGISEVVP